ncbi:hypothetical protein CALCODRAFT_31752 [Calocera cornea HHB12733]|uniref:Uncharacterized protein n=1 Tax=Calocera cornea HHB12733 TaxID=1353952 RepID=A0A165E1R9_9BASI|nr:hypothetical protein CALCODRAFT_31752 [Calocera cornea HHB12733]
MCNTMRPFVLLRRPGAVAPNTPPLPRLLFLHLPPTRRRQDLRPRPRATALLRLRLWLRVDRPLRRVSEGQAPRARVERAVPPLPARHALPRTRPRSSTRGIPRRAEYGSCACGRSAQPTCEGNEGPAGAAAAAPAAGRAALAAPVRSRALTRRTRLLPPLDRPPEVVTSSVDLKEPMCSTCTGNGGRSLDTADAPSLRSARFHVPMYPPRRAAAPPPFAHSNPISHGCFLTLLPSPIPSLSLCSCAVFLSRSLPLKRGCTIRSGVMSVRVQLCNAIISQQQVDVVRGEVGDVPWTSGEVQGPRFDAPPTASRQKVGQTLSLLRIFGTSGSLPLCIPVTSHNQYLVYEM